MSMAVHAVIAVKRLDRAKSRLAGELPIGDRTRLVLAMLDDTLRAAGAVPNLHSLTVVTPDPAVAATARRRGASVHPEPAGTGDPLNTALADAATALRRRHGPTALLALQADLPALRTAELAQALAAAPNGRRSIVVDHLRAGTSALLLRDGEAALAPMFGPDSARRHLDSGAIELDGDWPGLRLDVDTAADLTAALRLGAGPATRALLTEIGWTPRTPCRTGPGQPPSCEVTRR